VAVAKHYSTDLRERVLADADAGMPTKEVAAKYRVSRSWVRRLKQRRRETGEVGPRTPVRSTPRKLDAHAGRIAALVAAEPDATLAEIRGRLGLAAALSTLWDAVNRLGLTLKKR
jgi:transposase